MAPRHRPAEQLSAALLLPAGYRGPAFLVLDNFRAILKYNNSSSYALAVSLLSSASMAGPDQRQLAER
jgi:membrane-bound lytic murein transglycosylase B